MKTTTIETMARQWLLCETKITRFKSGLESKENVWVPGKGCCVGNRCRPFEEGRESVSDDPRTAKRLPPQFVRKS